MQIAAQRGEQMQHLVCFYIFYSNAWWQIHLTKLYKKIITSA